MIRPTLNQSWDYRGGATLKQAGRGSGLVAVTNWSTFPSATDTLDTLTITIFNRDRLREKTRLSNTTSVGLFSFHLFSFISIILVISILNGILS